MEKSEGDGLSRIVPFGQASSRLASSTQSIQDKTDKIQMINSIRPN